MSLITADGFDHYGNTGQMLGDIGWVGINMFITASNPRTGTGCMVNDGGNMVFNAGTLNPHLICGYAFYCSDLRFSQTLISFYSSAGTGATPHFTVNVNPGGFLEMYRWPNSGGPVLVYTSPFAVLFLGQYQYFEIEMFLDPVVGFVSVYREGVLIHTFTGNTLNPDVPANISVWSILGSNNNGKYLDDFYAVNVTDGVSPAGLLGPIKCRTVYPTADTAQADWILNGSGTGFGCINNVPQNIAVKFLDATAAAQQSLFDMGDLPVTVSSIAGVCVYSFQEKSDAGVCTTKVQMKSGATTNDGNTNSITTGPGYWRDIFRNDPNTGAAWTRAGFNAAQVGIDRVS